MSKILHTPHNTLFKAAFQDVERVRAFIKVNASPAVLKRVDLDSLQLTTNEFIKPECAYLHTDITYSCNIDNKSGYIYWLLEHQSTPDELMALRLLEYNVVIMRHHYQNVEKKFPPIVNFCVYNGKPPYPHSINFLDYCDDPTLSQELLLKPMPLIDLNAKEDDEIKRQEKTATVELLLKHRRDLINYLKGLKTKGEFRSILLEIATDQKYLAACILYTMEVSDAGRYNQEEILNLYAEALPEQKDFIMVSVAQRMTQEGFVKGKLEGKLETAKNMLSLKLDIETIQKATGLSIDQIKALKKRK